MDAAFYARHVACLTALLTVGPPDFFVFLICYLPVPVAARSKAWVCGRSPAEIVGSNRTGCTDVCCECRVLSGRGLCDELMTLPDESYRLWRVAVCDLETSKTRRLKPATGL